MDVTLANGNVDPNHNPEMPRTRRYEGKLYGERFCGDPRTGLVHDLEQETERCRLDDPFEMGCEQAFRSLADAHMDGYDSCPHCVEPAESS